MSYFLMMCMYFTQNDAPEYAVIEYECERVVSCEPADWIGIDGNGKADPKNYCTYETTTEYGLEMPKVSAYGEHCEMVGLVELPSSRNVIKN